MRTTATRWVLATVVAVGAAACDSEVNGGGGECADYANEPQAPVTLRFRNMGTTPLFLGSPGCGDLYPFTLRDESGAERPWYDDGCSGTCESLQEGQIGCPAVCLQPPLYRVEPGGQVDYSWYGLVREERAMPASCYGDAPQGSCAQYVQAPGGLYEITGTMYVDAMCEGSCDCQPNAEGWCELTGSVESGTGSLTATAPIALPQDTMVELLFP